MAETTPEAPAAESKFSKDAGMGSVGESSTPGTNPSYPYLQILQQLQSTAIRAQDPDNDNEEKSSDESPQTQTSSSSWDLSTDALLATLLHEFSSHIALRTHRVSSEIRSLQSAVNEAGVGVALCQTEFMKRSDDLFMEQVVGDDDDDDDDESDSDSNDDIGESGNPDAINDDGRRAVNVNVNVNTQTEERNEDDGDDESDDSSADIARLEAEEKSAISDGMKALNLFFDPKQRPPKPITNTNSGGGEGGSSQTMDLIVTDAEGDIIGENCYYYPSAEGDGFNQRPLPFIVGSREFMESSCAGLGGGVGGCED